MTNYLEPERRIFQQEILKTLNNINQQLNRIAISLDKIEAIKEKETGIDPDEFRVT